MAVEGRSWTFTGTDAVKVSDTMMTAEGAHATGAITPAYEKRRLGRAGKLDSSIDRVAPPWCSGWQLWFSCFAKV
jgi:hypothetical protein